MSQMITFYIILFISEILMRDNIVFFVSLFSLILYIPGAILVNRHVSTGHNYNFFLKEVDFSLCTHRLIKLNKQNLKISRRLQESVKNPKMLQINCFDQNFQKLAITYRGLSL